LSLSHLLPTGRPPQRAAIELAPGQSASESLCERRGFGLADEDEAERDPRAAPRTFELGDLDLIVIEPRAHLRHGLVRTSADVTNFYGVVRAERHGGSLSCSQPQHLLMKVDCASLVSASVRSSGVEGDHGAAPWRASHTLRASAIAVPRCGQCSDLGLRQPGHLYIAAQSSALLSEPSSTSAENSNAHRRQLITTYRICYSTISYYMMR